MVIDYGSGENSDWVKMPKVGEEPKEFKIQSCERIDDPEYKYNFEKNEPVMINGQPVVDDDGETVYKKVNQGYRYVYTLEDDKKFSISSWKPFYAFKAVQVQDGDHIRVSHPEKGEWKVEIISKGTPEAPEQFEE